MSNTQSRLLSTVKAVPQIEIISDNEDDTRTHESNAANGHTARRSAADLITANVTSSNLDDLNMLNRQIKPV